jgi:zinc protease
MRPRDLLTNGAGRRLILAAVLLLGGTAKAPALSVRLANGVTLQTVHPANAALISIRLLVPAGGRNDPRGSEGLAHYVEHLLASDPGPLQSASNAPRLSAHGSANAFTAPTVTVYVMNVPPESLELGLETIAERMSRLDAGADMAARELRIVRQEYAMSFGNHPGRRLMNELRTQLEQSDPALGWSIGTPETIKTFDLAAARAFFERWYRPETMTLVLSGPIEIDSVQEIAERTIGRIPHDAAPPPRAAPSPSMPAPITVKREDPDAAVPLVLRSAFAQAEAGSGEAVWREHAAMFALQLVLDGAKEGPKGLAASLRDGNDEITALSVALTRLDRRWLELTMALEADPAADPGSLADIVQARLAELSAQDVPETLLKEFKDAAGQTWKAAEDAGGADAVVGWLRMGFSLAERAQFVDALARVEVEDIVALAHKMAKPVTSATAIILPSNGGG